MPGSGSSEVSDNGWKESSISGETPTQALTVS